MWTLPKRPCEIRNPAPRGALPQPLPGGREPVRPRFLCRGPPLQELLVQVRSIDECSLVKRKGLLIYSRLHDTFSSASNDSLWFPLRHARRRSLFSLERFSHLCYLSYAVRGLISRGPQQQRVICENGQLLGRGRQEQELQRQEPAEAAEAGAAEATAAETGAGAAEAGTGTAEATGAAEAGAGTAAEAAGAAEVAARAGTAEAAAAAATEACLFGPSQRTKLISRCRV